MASLMCFYMTGCGTRNTEKQSKKKTSPNTATTVTEPGETGNGDKGGATGQTGTGVTADQRFDDIELSSKYLVGFDYSDYDLYIYSVVVFCKVRYDKKIEVEYTYPKSNGEYFSQTVVYDLTDEQYANIEREIDLRELYELDPEEADPENTMDGGYTWLLIYDKDENIAKRCGGFCPHSKRFGQMRRAIFDNLPEGFVEGYEDCKRRNEFYGNYLYGKYGVFLSVEEDLSQFSDYRTVVIDAQYFSREEIEDFQKDGHFVISYINVGSIENFRSYYAEYEELTLGDYENWDEEKWVDVSDARWQDFILQKLAPELLAKGIDGFFVDNCDVYYNYPTEEILDGLSVIMEGLVSMNKEVIVNGGDAFADAYVDAGGNWEDIMTAINQETVFTRIDFDAGELRARKDDDPDKAYFMEYIEKYAQMGAYIYLLEYTKNAGIEQKIQDYCWEHNFVYYVSDSIELDG